MTFFADTAKSVSGSVVPETREVTAYFCQMANALPHILWQADVGGRLIFVNQAWQEATGLTPVESFGDGYLQAFLPADRERLRSMQKWATAEGKGYELDVQLRHILQPHSCWYRVQANPLYEAGKVALWVVTGINIAVQRDLEAALEEVSERLRRAMQETHHRIKNNMQVIAALAEVQAANPETSAQAALQRIGHHVRTLALLNDMLTRELRDGKEVTAISAKDVLEELIVYLQSSLEHHVVNYAVDDVELPLAQSATVALLTSELISNATKHGGREIEVRLWREDKDIKLEVRDNGPGFPPDFDPETATSTGMEIIKSVARWDLRGDIGFHSLPGGGACVRVVWSARRKA